MNEAAPHHDSSACTPTARWSTLPVDLRLVLVWLGYARTDPTSAAVTVNVQGALARLARAVRELEAARLPETDAGPDARAVGPLEARARVIRLPRARHAPRPTRHPRKTP